MKIKLPNHRRMIKLLAKAYKRQCQYTKLMEKYELAQAKRQEILSKFY